MDPTRQSGAQPYRTDTLADPPVAAGQTVPLAQAEPASNLRNRLWQARLYVLLDGRESPDAFRQLACSLIRANVHVLQLRDKQLDDRERLARARMLRELTRAERTLFIVNDRADLAVLADADGVHLGQEDVSPADARKIIGPDRLMGVSTHSLPQVQRAVLDGADYLGCGPTFPSVTKSFDAFPGVTFLRQVAKHAELPAFAIGGITADNLPEVLAAGFPRVAVSSAVTAAEDPAASAQQLLLALQAARIPSRKNGPGGKYSADGGNPAAERLER